MEQLGLGIVIGMVGLFIVEVGACVWHALQIVRENKKMERIEKELKLYVKQFDAAVKKAEQHAKEWHV